MNVLDQIKKLEAELKYALEILGNGGLNEWEAKEYNALATSKEEEIKSLKQYVSDNSWAF